MNGSSPGIPRIDTDQIPDCVRESIGNALLRRFMENIRDPATKRRYDEFGQEFMERWEREHPAVTLADG